MDINDLHPPDDYSHRFFIWHEWIQANGPLTAENVFDYFTTSMFYDKQSNNQVLRMQTMHTGVPLENEAAELKRFTGVEFAVVHVQAPTFFVIQKRERLSLEEVRPLAAYFIMNNRIYQSPDIYTVISNRLLTSLNALQSSLDVLRRYRPDYTPRTGFVWPITDPSAVSETNKKRKADSLLGEDADLPQEEKQSDVPKRQQNNMLLRHAMNTTAAHSKLAFTASSSQNLDVAAVADTPATTTGRSSVTPAPQNPSDAASTKGSSATQESGKGSSGAGKKKKKRNSVAPQAGPST
ncbi:MED6-domain-containing protein [Agrocybe pediades]|nr:MED6-domain-containing protein [Agrocybe pediades]